MCNTCRKSRAGKVSPETKKRYYDARKSQGICVNCGSRLAEGEGLTTCETCSKTPRKVQKGRYNNLTASSRCTKCGAKLSPDSKITYCEPCRVARTSLVKKRRDKAREDGKCTKCLQRTPIAGKAWCENCYDKYNKWIEGKPGYWKKGHRKENDERAQKEGPALANLQESGLNTHMETELECDETAVHDSGADDMKVNDIVSGDSIDRMAITHIVN